MITQAAPLAMTIGEPAGIGPDLVLALFAQRKELKLPAFIAYGNLAFLRARAKRLGLEVVCTELTPDKFHKTQSVFCDALPVFDIGDNIPDTPKEPNMAGGRMVMDSIARATGDCLTGACRGLITAPLHKGALKRIGFEHPGHTEYLAHLCAGGGETPIPIMMLAHGDLRVVPLTIHVPLYDVPEMISTQMIVRKTRIIARDMKRRFGIEKPKIALTGLNPHAGENGAFGLEERDEIAPAIAILQKEGIEASGPYPADTAFHIPNWKQFDVIVAMYHDQALIPIKTMAFYEAVNITLGLPIVRTSPDHGTAFELAGHGNANSQSMLAAIRLADKMTGKGFA